MCARIGKSEVAYAMAREHGCTFFSFLVEARGNDHGTSVDSHGCCHGLPWKSAGFPGKGHDSWCFHRKCHGCGHGTCGGSVRGKLHGTNHGNPRKSSANATAISANVKPQRLPRPSAAICGHCHGNPPILGNYHRSPRQLPRQFPRTSIHNNFHGHPRPLPRQSSDTRQLPRKSAVIATAISADVKPQHFAIRGNPPIHGNCHGSPRQFPRYSVAIEFPR